MMTLNLGEHTARYYSNDYEVLEYARVLIQKIYDMYSSDKEFSDKHPFRYAEGIAQELTAENVNELLDILVSKGADRRSVVASIVNK